MSGIEFELSPGVMLGFFIIALFQPVRGQIVCEIKRQLMQVLAFDQIISWLRFGHDIMRQKA